MKSIIRPFVISALLLAPASVSIAQTYGAGIENSEWYLSSSVFNCTLTHQVPGYGRAVFQHRAGERLTFYLESDGKLMKPGNGQLVVEAPSWRPGVNPQPLGAVAVSRERRAVTVDPLRSMAMVQGLMSGMSPTVTRTAWYSSDPVRVKVSNINFAANYGDYQTCVASLLPINYDQIQRSKIHFSLDSAVLNDADYERLDLIIRFIQADTSISKIYVDGHTDSSGSRIHNRSLSEERANAVTEYLVQQGGIDREKLVTRYHGERYPASSRPAENRRTTVRLEREGERRGLQRAEADADPRKNG
ncbi:flagellar protein MotY [Marinobacter sp. 1Y8]